ncbi:helix-turn-helix transcriptional regulator [Enterococcus faecium]|nr:MULTISPECIES: helix-turn-helix transcriptional regulator [Enterococcus]MBY3652911.1 helix-turn-helix transcriptional regulator [Enterococcus faecium]MCH3196924.1 helix-turn-helix transcriptional regulator [Enterococcus faecium]MCH3207911.1 helix-turn-helix transcriptional regulator [Enterococcus faecium]MCH3241062.1 helix-turn-helix transcriptional regulator [Enterococcus faecium]MCH3298531.1 helix-turn-helix transcriptional regulator [Enterococcus faecium]
MTDNEINAILSLIKTKKDEVVRLDSPVRKYRRFCGYRQKELAELLEISELTYRNKEKGRVPFKDYEIERIVKLFHKDGIHLDIVDIFFSDLKTKKDE